MVIAAPPLLRAWHAQCINLFSNTVPHRLQRTLAYLCLAMSMTLVGIYVSLSKPLVAAIPVFLLGWMRFGIAAVAMALWLKKPKSEEPLDRRTRILLFFESFLGNFMFSICMLFGVSMTSTVSAGVILAGIPAVSALMSGVFLKERMGLRIWLAVACGAAGMAMLSLAKQPAGASPSAGDAQRALWGNLLVFGSVVCEAAYIVIGKRLTSNISPKRIAAIINLYGFALMTPMGLYVALQFDFAAVHAASWGLLVFYALAASVGTVWLWMTGLQTVPAGQAGVFSVMLPLTAAGIGALFFKEPFTALQASAFAVALLGLLLATLPERERSGQAK